VSDSDGEYVMERENTDIENGDRVYVKAPDKDECLELFEEASKE